MAVASAQLAVKFGEKVRVSREATGISQRELALRMPNSQATAARVEAGGTSATLTSLERVATALGLELTITSRLMAIASRCVSSVAYIAHVYYCGHMTKPTNVLLDPALRAAAKRRAYEQGLSLSAYIHELIRNDDAAAAARAGDITPLIGFLGAGAEPSDIATNKHEMIQQAFSEALDHKLSTATGPE